jgi:hypothetical protein
MAYFVVTRREARYTRISLTACMVVGLLSAIPSSCGSLDKQESATPAAGTAGPPTPTVTPGMTYQSWSSIDASYNGEVASNASPAPPPSPSPSPGASCELPRKIAISRDGSFVAGPCHTGASDVGRGNVNPADFQLLLQLTTALGEGDPTAPPACDTDTQYGQLSVTLAFQDGSASQVFQYPGNPGEGSVTCYRGGTDSAKNLAREVRVIMDQAYAQALGAPPAP